MFNPRQTRHPWDDRPVVQGPAPAQKTGPNKGHQTLTSKYPPPQHPLGPDQRYPAHATEPSPPPAHPFLHQQCQSTIPHAKPPSRITPPGARRRGRPLISPLPHSVKRLSKPHPNTPIPPPHSKPNPRNSCTTTYPGARPVAAATALPKRAGPVTARSGRVRAVIQRHRVLRLGEEQPALDDKAERRARHRQPGENGADPAGENSATRVSRPARRRRRAARRAQPDPVLAGDAVAHFLQQVIVLGVRRLEQAHPAAAAERGGAGDRARRRGGRVDQPPIGFLERPGGGDREQGQDRGAGRPEGPRSGPAGRAAGSRPSARAQNSSARSSGCATDGSASARRRSCRCSRSCRPRAPRRAMPHRPRSPRRAEEDPADREDRRRHEGRDRQHALARQPRRAPLRKGAPRSLRPPEVKDRRDQPAGRQHESGRQGRRSRTTGRAGRRPSGTPSPSRNSSANPAPEAVVKKTIEKAGCIGAAPAHVRRRPSPGPRRWRGEIAAPLSPHLRGRAARWDDREPLRPTAAWRG